MLNLSLNETRVLGALFEKEHTTPDQYPLSRNALMNACNQKSNRDPVLSLSENEVQDTLDSLTEKGLVLEVLVGSRTPKYKQRFGNTEFSDMKLSLKEQSVMNVLFLRGPQTPGELRTRTSRLCDFANVGEVESVLNDLIQRSGDAYVAKLEKEPGMREARYAHLFSGEPVISATSSVNPAASYNENTSFSPTSSTSEDQHIGCHQRIDELEQTVAELQNQVLELKQAWDDLAG